MSSQITKLVLVPLEEWKCPNKNGGDTYTTIEIPSFKNPQEGRGKKKEEEEQQEVIPPPPPPPIPHHSTSWDDEELGQGSLLLLLPPPPREEGQKEGEGKGKKGGGGGRGIEIIGNVGNRLPGIRVMKKRKNTDTSTTVPHKWIHL